MNRIQQYLPLFVKAVQLYYPLDNEILAHFADRLNWKWVTENAQVHWNTVLLEKYRDWIHWHCLGHNNIVFTDEILDCFHECLNWSLISANTLYFVANDEYLRPHPQFYSSQAVFNKGPEWIQLNRYPTLNCSLETFLRFEERWDWRGLSQREDLPWSREYLHRLRHRLDGYELSANKRLPWTQELVWEFRDLWDWTVLATNPALPWDDAFLDWFQTQARAFLPEDELVQQLCANSGIPWPLERVRDFIARNEVRACQGLSANPNLPWSMSLLERYQKSWCWSNLTLNAGLPWNIELIERFHDDFEFVDKVPYDAVTLANNHYIPWSIELIEHFNTWRWRDEGLSSNPSLPWSMALIEHFKHKWSWNYLSTNPAICWDEEMVLRFEKEINQPDGRSLWGIYLNLSTRWNWSLLERIDNWSYAKLCERDELPEVSSNQWTFLFAPLLNRERVIQILEQGL